MADDEASFSTSIDCISCGLILLRSKLSSIGTPSTTYSGLDDALSLIEVAPRTFICTDEPGAPDVDCMSTPASSPCSAAATLVSGRSTRASPFTCATALVISPRFTEP